MRSAGEAESRTAVASKMTSSGPRGRPREWPGPEDGKVEIELGALKAENTCVFQWPARDIVNSRGRPCRELAGGLSGPRKEGRKTHKEPVLNLLISHPIEL